MKTKFWIGYSIAVLITMGCAYFVTAQISEVPLVLSDSQMEQLSGALTDWDCVQMESCTSTSGCNNNTLLSIIGSVNCNSCETRPNTTCFYPNDVAYCVTCTVIQYKHRCGGKIEETNETKYKECG